METKYKIWSLAALCVFLMTVASCERNTEGLQPATYPTTPDVFIDGFSTGLYYAAYGTSKVTAFSVDYNVKYSGTASMKFEVPDAGDPNGSYAGGVFGTNPGRNLSGYNVLTFWAKASQPASIIEVGYGSDMGASKYKVTLTNVALNSNWMEYYIPIPDPSLLKQERGMFFYAAAPQNGKGYTFWIDELKFESMGTISHANFGIFNGQDSILDNAETGEQLQISDFYASFNLPSGIDQRVQLTSSYYKFSSSDTSVATVNENGTVTISDTGIAVISARVGKIPAAGSLTINVTSMTYGPQEPAPKPTIPADQVISMFSNVYPNVPVDTWNTYWQYSTAENQQIQINGDDVIRYKKLNFVGIEFSSQPIDASQMTYFHIDIWTPDSTANKTFKIKLIDFGANGAYGGGDDSNSEISVGSPPLATRQWIGINIPLASFSGLLSRSHLAQLVLSGQLPNVYIDNVYFYKNGSVPAEPTTPAPVPGYAPANVVSVFSDSYNNIPGTNFNPNWGQATVVSQVPIVGNNTLKYKGLNYQGIQLGSSQNVSGMSYLHLDFWSANSINLNVFLISTGPVEKSILLPVPTSGWSGIDIPLSSFAPVVLTDVIQFKFVGNGDIYLDNIFFHK